MIKTIAIRFWQVGRDGLRLWWLAPVIPLIVILPEFIQHIAEIKLGMFASLDAFKQMQNDPDRWFYGYFKIAGLFLGILAAARFWAAQSQSARWWSLRTIAWRPFLIALALNCVATIGLLPLEGRLDETALQIVSVAVSIATLPLLVMMIGAFLGDATTSLKKAYRSGWGQALMMAIMFFAVMLGLQPLHQFNHTLAMGQPAYLVWLLMVWDSLLVGAMATLAGTALHHGYVKLGEPIP